MSEMVVFFNGKFVPESQAHLPLLTHSFHYGTGVFEGIRAYHERASGRTSIFRAEDHFKRMARNTKILKIALPMSPSELVEVAAELIRANGYATDVYLRPLAYKKATKVGVGLPEGDGFLMLAVPMGDYVDTRKGLHCGVSTWRRLPDNSIPCHAKICGAYVNSALAAQEARDRGFDEAIFLNEAGGVAEGSAMNLFLVRDGHLLTPDVSQGILEGITRDTVMVLASEALGISCEQRPVDRAELYEAEEVFLCGTAAQIAPVTRIDGREVGSGRPGKITLQIQGRYESVVRAKPPGYRRWLTAVELIEETGDRAPEADAA